MNIITSKNNPKIKSTTKLQIQKYRNYEKMFLVEGSKVIEMALASSCCIKTIFYDADKREKFQELLRVLEQNNIQIFAISDDAMKKLSTSKSPQGIVAVVNFLEYEKEKKYQDLIVACDGVSDPGNMGTIIRTADAVGASAVIVNDDCVDIYNDKVIRASMGSIFNIDIVSSNNLVQNISNLQKKGYIAGCGHLKGSNFFERKKQGKTIIVIGNEAKGVSEEIEDACDCKWKLPMYGKAESFNAAIAAGIMMYDIVRK